MKEWVSIKIVIPSNENSSMENDRKINSIGDRIFWEWNNENTSKLPDKESYKQIAKFTKHLLRARNLYVIEIRTNERLLCCEKI